MKVVNIKDSAQAADIFKKIGVDPYGINAMAVKAININVLLENQPCKIANIIKQEMLSVGGDAAVARGSVACSLAATDILMMGTMKQHLALALKLEKQPFGLHLISQNLKQVINNIQKNKHILKTSRREIVLGENTKIMGILNVTPDSFSDGGLFDTKQKAIDHGLKMIDQGADMIDIGGESTRPGAKPVSAKEELKRVIPIIKGLARQVNVPISVDTMKALVAREAIAEGAEIINDISALKKDRQMSGVVRESKAALILMHMRGKPRYMQEGDLKYNNLMGEIIDYLEKSVSKAIAYGIDESRLVIDPGIGFGKTPEDNYRIINRLSELKILGFPVLIGTSRKSFIGKVVPGEARDRIEGTAATVTASILNGCHIIRVHDVEVMKKVATVTDAILGK